MAWVDYTYMRNMVGTTQASSLGLSTASAVLVQYEADARSTVLSLMKAAGYAALGSTLDTSASGTPFLQKLVGSLMARNLYGFRAGIEFPPLVREGLAILSAYERGEGKRFPIPGMTQDSEAGIGGSQVTPETSTSTGNRPLIFARNKTVGL